MYKCWGCGVGGGSGVRGRGGGGSTGLKPQIKEPSFSIY